MTDWALGNTNMFEKVDFESKLEVLVETDYSNPMNVKERLFFGKNDNPVLYSRDYMQKSTKNLTHFRIEVAHPKNTKWNYRGTREIGDNFENGYSLTIHFRYDEASLRGDIIKLLQLHKFGSLPSSLTIHAHRDNEKPTEAEAGKILDSIIESFLSKDFSNKVAYLDNKKIINGGKSLDRKAEYEKYEEEYLVRHTERQKARPTSPSLTSYGKDLSGTDLSGSHLFDRVPHLAGANLTGANLTGMDLTGRNLTGTDLTDANLTGVNLNGMDLTRTTLTGANLTGANLCHVNLAYTDLTDVDLSKVMNLTGANLTNAYIKHNQLADLKSKGAITTGYKIIGDDPEIARRLKRGYFDGSKFHENSKSERAKLLSKIIKRNRLQQAKIERKKKARLQQRKKTSESELKH